MKYFLLLMSLTMTVIGSSSSNAAASAPPNISLEKIMADPDWIGPAVRDAYWSADGRTVYYSLKRSGSPIFDLHRIDPASGKDQILDAAAMADADAPAVYDRAGTRAAFVRNGDIFVRDLATGHLRQITRTAQPKSAARFSADGKLLTFRSGNDWFVHDFAGGVTAAAAIVKSEKDPNAPPKPDDLRDMQLRTFATLKKLHDETEATLAHNEALQKGDATRAVMPFYLGDEVTVRDTELSPDAHWLIVVTEPKSHERGREGKLTRYVTESGYEEFETERLRVGRNPPAPQSFVLLNLADHTAHALSLDDLPGIYDDPLKAVREENAKARATADPKSAVDPRAAGAPEANKPRGVWAVSREPDFASAGPKWSDDGGALGIELFSIDNKDRWIVSVDLAKYSLVPQHRLS